MFFGTADSLMATRVRVCVCNLRRRKTAVDEKTKKPGAGKLLTRNSHAVCPPPPTEHSWKRDGLLLYWRFRNFNAAATGHHGTYRHNAYTVYETRNTCTAAAPVFPIFDALLSPVVGNDHLQETAQRHHRSERPCRRTCAVYQPCSRYGVSDPIYVRAGGGPLSLTTRNPIASRSKHNTDATAGPTIWETLAFTHKHSRL